MTKVVFRTRYSDESVPGRVNRKPSLTIPGQSYTIQQLKDRLSMGLPVNVPTNANFIPEGMIRIDDLTDIDALQAEFEVISKKITKAKADSEKPAKEPENGSE